MVSSAPLAVRRLAALLVALVLAGLAAFLVLEDRGMVAADAHLVATGPRTTATVTEISYQPRNHTEYRVRTREGTHRMEYGWSPASWDCGDTVEVALDPDDPGRALAVGDPGDPSWNPDWRHSVFTFLFFPGVALVAASYAAAKLVPEDVARLGRLGKRPD